MKRTTLIFSLCALLIIIGTSGIKSVTNSGNPPSGNTGATGSYCTNCHSGNSLNTAGGGAVISGLPTATGGYALNQAYNFSLTINHSAVNRKRWGFAIKAINSSGAAVGIFTTTNINANVGSGELRHNSAPTSANANTYTFNNLKWTAPTTNTLTDKTIRFYVVGLAADGTGGTGGDFVYATSINAPFAAPAVSSIKSFSPTKANSGSVVTIKGTAFTGATNVNFGGINAASYNVINDSTINATVGSGATGTIAVTSPSGVATLSGFIFCPTAITTSSNFNGCNSFTYKGNTYTTNTSIKDTLKSSNGCDSVFNTANINITNSLSPRIVIDADNSNACYGQKVIFTATPTNGGANAGYQWSKNGIMVGSNNAVYIDSLLNNGDSIYCVLTSSLTCVTATTAKSNTYGISINHNISGNIITPNKTAVKNVIVKKNSSTIDSVLATSSYSFNCSKVFSNGVIRASKNNDIKKNNGVSSIDVILVQNHILNKIKLNSPYKIIASDVNNNKTVTNIDLIFMKRLILGLDTTFTGNRLWAFVDSAYKFADTTNPFPYKDSISINNLTSNKNNQTFIGVKLGDVNYDWNPTQARGIEIENLELIVDNKKFIYKNNEVSVPILVKNFKDLKALQYTLHFDNNKYEFINLEGSKNLEGLDFNVAKCNNTGNISFLWTNTKGEETTLPDETEIFKLVLKSKEFGSKQLDLGISLSNEITEMEAWDKNYNQHNITLTKRLNKKEQPTASNEIWTVNPNPTSGDVLINFNASENKTVVFELTNLQGKTILQQNVNVSVGENNININLKKKMNVADGIYLLKAIGLNNLAAKRILIKRD